MRILKANECDHQALLMRTLEKNGAGPVVESIIRRVREEGDAALRSYSSQFDHVILDEIEIPSAEWQKALDRISPELRGAMETAREHIETYHRHQVRTGFRFESGDTFMGQMITPIENVGIYIPGGTAAYPSTVLMNAIPAKIAGCRQIIMVSPPGREGTIPDAILAAAALAGVDRVFRVGGAQAIAALAFGTESIPKVDKIVGPGNTFVAEAKKQVFGQVAIDMIAGPSEILVVADGNSNPEWVAADLLSQAEHDKLATAVLITESESLANAVSEAVTRQLRTLPREEIATTSIEDNGKILLVSGIEEAIDLANELAPEHLELCLDEPEKWLSHVKNAGSVFLGRYCPESLGDYLAGPNHTLPTSGTARFSSALGVDDFIKKIQYTYYTENALGAVADKIATFARAEGLEAHARAALIRSE